MDANVLVVELMMTLIFQRQEHIIPELRGMSRIAIKCPGNPKFIYMYVHCPLHPHPNPFKSYVSYNYCRSDSLWQSWIVHEECIIQWIPLTHCMT